MKILLLFLVLTFGGVPLAARASAADSHSESVAGAEKSGLPVPRFVSVRAQSVNVRTGPGERYPVKWVLKRRGMPVEIIAEYETWRQIRDWEGTEGWVHQALLSGRRAAVIHPAEGILRQKPDAIARPLARLQKGLIVDLKHCDELWCALELGATRGWISKSSLWGIYAHERLE